MSRLLSDHVRRSLDWLEERWTQPVDAAGLGAFRFLFGLVALLGALRFWGLGWIESQYLQPEFHFTYPGFRWVHPWPGTLMYVHFALLSLAALGLCLGWYARVCAGVYFLLFSYAELIEQASYLNHYYLVSLVSFLLIFLPSGASLSIDALRRTHRGVAPRQVNRGSYWLLRAQMSIVYVSAGVAKLGEDWLLDAQPLSLWLAQRADYQLVGPLLAFPVTAYLMSWAGMLYDCTIWLWLSLRSTRRYAYAVAVAFHLSVWALFPIGMFSWVMLVVTTIFFAPTWPRDAVRWLAARWPRANARRRAESLWLELPSVGTGETNAGRTGLVAASLFLCVQAALPLRHVLYPGVVNWNEQGFRFAWRVMLIEKAGQVEFEVVTPSGESRIVYPRSHLNDFQYKMMSTQPDMIRQFARWLAKRYGQGGAPARVYARAFASLNGRPSQWLIEPGVDLAREPLPSRWIVPLGESPVTETP